MHTILILPLGIVVVVLGTAAYLMARLDMSSASYPDYDAAVSAGAIGPGKWLPSVIPESSRQIEEAHNVDTNELWFTLSYSDWAVDGIDGCKAVSKAEANVPSRERTSQFPRFAQTAREEIAGDDGLSFLACVGSDYDFFLAVQPIQKVVHGWSLGDSATR